MHKHRELFAVSLPGFEAITSLELKSLGIDNQPTHGGVAFSGGLREIYLSNLWLRTAHRILLRMGSFTVTRLNEIPRKVASIPWEEFISTKSTINVKAASYRSRLYHEGAIAQRIKEGIKDRLETTRHSGNPGKALVTARVVSNHCVISLDSSGEHLHKRGYRLDQGKAPLRETIAAAMLLASGWQKEDPLLDPFCGAGTIAIEAALIALERAPGIMRPFAFQEWNNYQGRLWEELRQATPPSTFRPTIIASDMSHTMVEKARINASRAGVDGYIQWDCRPFTFLPPLPPHGHLVSNPPYGVRLSGDTHLPRLYERLNKLMKKRLSTWKVALLAPPNAVAHLDLDLTRKATLYNGGIKVHLLTTPHSIEQPSSSSPGIPCPKNLPNENGL